MRSNDSSMRSCFSLFTSSYRCAIALWYGMTLVSLSAAVPYEGSLCQGAIDFDLKDNLDYTALDAAVVTGLALFPRWIEPECYRDLQKISCMQTYTPHANSTTTLGYCYTECYKTVDSCQSTIKLTKQSDNAVDFTLLLGFQCYTAANGATCTD